MGLAINLAATTELCNQAFATHEARNPTTAGLTDIKLQGVLERDDMSGVDHIASIDIHFVNRTETVEKNVPLSRTLYPKKTPSDEKSAFPIPWKERSMSMPSVDANQLEP